MRCIIGRGVEWRVKVHQYPENQSLAGRAYVQLHTVYSMDAVTLAEKALLHFLYDILRPTRYNVKELTV